MSFRWKLIKESYDFGFFIHIYNSSRYYYNFV